MNKLEKTLIVSEIIESIQGHFIKKDTKRGRFVVCPDQFTREKVSQSLRDSLSGQYRSSTAAKKQRRSKVFQKMHQGAERVIHSNVNVSKRIEQLTTDIKRQGAFIPDESVCNLFNQANMDILETIKRDSALVDRFQRAELAASEATECETNTSPMSVDGNDLGDMKKAAPSARRLSKNKFKKPS